MTKCLYFPMECIAEEKDYTESKYQKCEKKIFELMHESDSISPYCKKE